eukprot:TRINITY_DN4830_c0_g2_i2.p1 TRINITY_DN4830_c0_g2~~TRINITY_DN4830_c0_g2_i2.p1  ORF type:complete len:268 (-),score=-22.90 TRINITY_DN4830_c0_g2_i2:628-1431(-)
MSSNTKIVTALIQQLTHLSILRPFQFFQNAHIVHVNKICTKKRCKNKNVDRITEQHRSFLQSFNVSFKHLLHFYRNNKIEIRFETATSVLSRNTNRHCKLCCKSREQSVPFFKLQQGIYLGLRIWKSSSITMKRIVWNFLSQFHIYIMTYIVTYQQHVRHVPCLSKDRISNQLAHEKHINNNYLQSNKQSTYKHQPFFTKIRLVLNMKSQPVSNHKVGYLSKLQYFRGVQNKVKFLGLNNLLINQRQMGLYVEIKKIHNQQFLNCNV